MTLVLGDVLQVLGDIFESWVSGCWAGRPVSQGGALKTVPSWGQEVCEGSRIILGWSQKHKNET